MNSSSPASPGSLQEELSLRPLRSGDLAWFVEVRNSARHLLHDSRRFSTADAEAWFAAGERPDFFVIELSGEPVGYFRIERLVSDSGVLQVGADLAQAFRGRGIAEAAYRKFLPKFADEYRADRFSLRVLPQNTRALRLYRKLGFVTYRVAIGTGPGRSLEIADIEMRRAVEELDHPSAVRPADFVDHIIDATSSAPSAPPA